MTEPTRPQPTDTATPRGWGFDFSVPVSSLRIGARLASTPSENSVVLTVEAQRGGESVSAAQGLMWSKTMGVQFLYFPGGDDPSWLSPEILFDQPVDSARIQALRWPSRRPLEDRDVARLFVEVSERSGGPGGEALGALYLAPVGGRSA